MRSKEFAMNYMNIDMDVQADISEPDSTVGFNGSVVITYILMRHPEGGEPLKIDAQWLDYLEAAGLIDLSELSEAVWDEHCGDL